jgi:outer membrane protein OmpA-like peptidoglycan-associated protein
MSKNKNKLPLLLVLLLLLPGAGALYAQGPYREARTGTVGLRLDGGLSWSFGSSFENVGANEINLFQPYGDAGLLFNIKPWFRIGADYSITRMIREQMFTSLSPVTGGGVLPGSAEGVTYRDLKSLFHGASLTGEFNLLDLGKNNNQGRFAMWLGIGAGYLFSRGNIWELSVSDVLRSDNWSQTIQLYGHNTPQPYNAPFIPATLSLEFSFLPQVALSIGGGYRYVISKSDIAPKSQAYAKAGLVFNLTGKGKRSEAPALLPVAPMKPDTVVVEKVVEKAVEKIVEVPAPGMVITDDMLPYVTFDLGSSKLDETVNAYALAMLVSVLKANPSVNFDVFGWTDHSGSDDINDPLSAARANVLRDYLVSQGISASRILSVKGLGKYPVSGEDAFSAKSRRAQAVVRN